MSRRQTRPHINDLWLQCKKISQAPEDQLRELLRVRGSKNVQKRSPLNRRSMFAYHSKGKLCHQQTDPLQDLGTYAITTFWTTHGTKPRGIQACFLLISSCPKQLGDFDGDDILKVWKKCHRLLMMSCMVLSVMWLILISNVVLTIKFAPETLQSKLPHLQRQVVHGTGKPETLCSWSDLHL